MKSPAPATTRCRCHRRGRAKRGAPRVRHLRPPRRGPDRGNEKRRGLVVPFGTLLLSTVPRSETPRHRTIRRVVVEQAGRLHGKPTGMARAFETVLPTQAGLTGVVVVLKFTLTFASVSRGASA